MTTEEIISEDQKKIEDKLKLDAVTRYVSEANLPIRGKFIQEIENIRQLTYPKNRREFNKDKMLELLNRHVVIRHRTGQESRSGVTTSDQNHLYIAKSTIGAKRKVTMNYPKELKKCQSDDPRVKIFDAESNDFNIEDTVEEGKHNLYAKSGYGLFANRFIPKDELIGIYMGTIKHYLKCRDSHYKMKFPGVKKYVIDAEGGMGHMVYFGIHFSNDMGKEGRNILVDPHLRVFVLRDIQRHEELYNWYGDNALDNTRFEA